ncbi:MAG: type II toxin-antitoxin system PemK/MazF family toxin [Candidatus Limnocylindrales bacterium]
MSVPRQREVWLVRLDPIRGHEQAGTRPVVVVSRDEVNHSGWSLCLGVPLSTRHRGSPLHVEILPPEGGVRAASYALVDQIRALDRARLVERWGDVSIETHRRIASILLRIVAPR